MSGYSRRVDKPLSEAFAKDAADEDFLEHLNLLLAPHEREQLDLDAPEVYPTLHVVGSPRSGTTLLYQVIASALDVGYVNNLSAAFWLAPTYGVRLARKLGVDRLSSSFSSAFGRTSGVAEPHEFGYFWSHHLRYPDMRQRDAQHEATIDWPVLRATIIAMAGAQGRPMTFKPMLMAWHMRAMLGHMPRSAFVWISRPARETALSLIKMRRSLYGDETRWASLHPHAPELDGEPVWRQVAAQVVLIEKQIGQVADELGPEHVLTVPYSHLCAQPDAVVTDVARLMGSKGHTPERRDVVLEPFVEGGNRALEQEFGERVDEAVAFYQHLYADR